MCADQLFLLRIGRIICQGSKGGRRQAGGELMRENPPTRVSVRVCWSKRDCGETVRRRVRWPPRVYGSSCRAIYKDLVTPVRATTNESRA